MVLATVYLVYAENTALKMSKTPIDDTSVGEKPIVCPVHQRPIDIHKEYVSLWLKRERSTRESLRIKESEDTFETKNGKNKKQYPKLAFNANGIAGGCMEIPKNAMINEILAQAMRVVIPIHIFIYLNTKLSKSCRHGIAVIINCIRILQRMIVF
ncbi:MAG: hypothetical protein H0X02_08165 [Nitrosomonas sp.]|nr:hypothetical protein [Nitrosomonas sp.]